jgi:beta-phosphoglucomutase-like phosphatase (HAD superfamily)
MAIVTAGHLDQLRLSVPQSFLSHFNALITGDLVSRGKPDPEPFLKGAQRLSLTPQECIAVENAPLGIQSARRANIYCVGVCSTVDRNQLADADEIVMQFADLRNSVVIQQILESRRSHA